MKRSSRVALSFICLALFWLIWLRMTAPGGVPDAQQIKQQLNAAISAANDKDASGVMSIVSRSYKDTNGDNPEQLHLLLRQAFENVQTVQVSTSALTVTVSGMTAQSVCDLVIHADGNSEFNGPITLLWTKESTRRYLIFPTQMWRVTHSNFIASLPGFN